jgi:hypothetical protein
LGKPDRRRKAGRPKLKWLDSIENGLKFIGIKRLRKKAEDRSVWAIILKEALSKNHMPKKKKKEKKNKKKKTKRKRKRKKMNKKMKKKNTKRKRRRRRRKKKKKKKKIFSSDLRRTSRNLTAA